MNRERYLDQLRDAARTAIDKDRAQTWLDQTTGARLRSGAATNEPTDYPDDHGHSPRSRGR
jgi:hypothetical protein